MALLDRLTQVEAFEQFLHRSFPGKTRFSIEGLDMMVPILDEVIAESAEAGTRNILIGMAHRGRLNVMAHVLNKPYAQILAEFKDPVSRRASGRTWPGPATSSTTPAPIAPSRAARRWISSCRCRRIPAISKRSTRSSRAWRGRRGRRWRGRVRRVRSGAHVPILIHGDAAFPGQGVVAETLNLSRLPGYNTGGTIHIIANNQLGFTTGFEDAYSTLYASGLARGFKIPIIHVNADDPEACVEAARLALAYREKFQSDFLIDLIGYRRYGHNEGDEPSFTQPLMYQKIASHPTVRELWAKTLVERGVVSEEQVEAISKKHYGELQGALDALQPEQDFVEPQPEPPPPGAARAPRRACRSSSCRRSTGRC